MHMQWHDWVGLVGVVIVLIAFFLLQVGKLHGTGFIYQSMNAVAAAAVVLSLLYDFNLSAFVVETAWVAISVYGMIRSWRARQIE
jgi:paired small multidrug resistance pump